MADFSPNIEEFHQAEQEVLKARVRGIRAAIQHSGEKGRSAELQVMRMLRDYLPAEYGLSTGFIAYRNAKKHEPQPDQATLGPVQITSQLDVIIYDALRCGPLIRLEGCDVFPIEAVYGFVEVKTAIRSTEDLRSLLKQSSRVREPRTRMYHSTVPGRPTSSSLLAETDFVSVRNFLFAFESTQLGTPEEAAEKLRQVTAECTLPNAFIAGAYLADTGFLGHFPVASADDPRKGAVFLDTEAPLQTFMHRLLVDLSRFPRVPAGRTPALDLYSDRLERDMGGPIVFSIQDTLSE